MKTTAERYSQMFTFNPFSTKVPILVATLLVHINSARLSHKCQKTSFLDCYINPLLLDCTRSGSYVPLQRMSQRSPISSASEKYEMLYHGGSSLSACVQCYTENVPDSVRGYIATSCLAKRHCAFMRVPVLQCGGKQFPRQRICGLQCTHTMYVHTKKQVKTSIQAGYQCYHSLPTHWLSKLATNTTSHSPPSGYQCWPPMLPLPLLPAAINAGYQWYCLLSSHRLLTLYTRQCPKAFFRVKKR